MFFKNLLIYRLTQQIAFEVESLQAALAAKPARTCASQELATYGFAAPLGKGEDAPLVHASSGFLLVAAHKEERILPGSVVRDELKAKVDAIEAEQLRKVYKKERDRLKEDLIQTLLPRAFIRRGTTFAAIMPRQGLILIDTASTKKAEDLLSTLREAVGSLPVRPLGVKIAPSATLTGWVKAQQAAADFHVLDECEMRDTHTEGGVIRCKRQDLTGEEIQPHLSIGKQVTQLSLAWQDKLSFVLDDNLAIKRLRFEDLLQEQAAQDGGDDELAQQDASFTLMMLTFAKFIPALIEALGGEEIPQGLGEAAPSSMSSREARPEAPIHLIEAIDATLEDCEDDPLYAEAVQFVRQNGHASISAVQRHFKIGYNRAARLIERMQAEGIITQPNAEGAREVVGVATQ